MTGSHIIGSNDELKADVAKVLDIARPALIKRTILHLCKSRAECSYFEAKAQFAYDVLLDDSFYNSWIMVRVRADHLTKLKHRME